MKIICFVTACLLINTFVQAQDKGKIDNAILNLKESLLKRDFNFLKPFLAESYMVGDFKRPKADKIIPQLLEQWPLLVSLEVTKVKVMADSIIVSIDYEYEGHLFGSTKTSSTCTLSPANKFIRIRYFDNILKKAIRK